MTDTVRLKQFTLSSQRLQQVFEDEYGVCLVQEGKGALLLNGIEHILEKDMVCLICPEDRASFSCVSSMQLLCIKVESSAFSHPLFAQLISVFHTKPNLRVFTCDNDTKQILDEISSLSSDNTFLSQLIFSKLIQMLCSIGSKLTFEPTTEASPHGKISAAVLRYINENLDKSISLDDIAGSMFISKYYMSHIFKKEMGISVGEMVLLKKMQYADYLLEQGISTKRVCEMIGFSSYSAFFRIYKRINGHTPQEKLLKKV